jgi:VanZ family protein
MRSRLGLWGPVLAFMAFIFYESSQPEVPALVERIWDKLLHSGAYAVLGALMLRALSGGFRRPVTAGVASTAVLLTTLYGASDEIHQSFVPRRQMDGRDLVADFTGASVVAIAGYLWFRRQGMPHPPERFGKTL